MHRQYSTKSNDRLTLLQVSKHWSRVKAAERGPETLAAFAKDLCGEESPFSDEAASMVRSDWGAVGAERSWDDAGVDAAAAWAPSVLGTFLPCMQGWTGGPSVGGATLDLSAYSDSACLTVIPDMRHYAGFYSPWCLKNGLFFGFPA